MKLEEYKTNLNSPVSFCGGGEGGGGGGEDHADGYHGGKTQDNGQNGGGPRGVA